MARATPRRRLSFAVVGAFTLIAIATSAVGALSGAYPIQSRGDRGTDVLAIQLLLRHDGSPSIQTQDGRTMIVVGRNSVAVPADGIFGAATVDGVRAFQAARGLPPTGVVTAPTWSALAIPLAPGARGDAVRALQQQLREKRAASIPLDGIYGTTTRAAVIAVQRHMSLAQTGSVNATTWRALAWHFELPRFSAAGLCDYSTGNGLANWGTAETISTLEASGAAMVAAGYGRVGIGDVSFEHGGNIPDHVTHEIGLDADLRPMRRDNGQCAAGTRWNLTTYDRAATRALVKAIRAATQGHIKLVYFNDPVLIREGLTRYFASHDDHLHLRICETSHPDPRYRC